MLRCFQRTNIPLSFKNKHIFEKKLYYTIVCWEITFSIKLISYRNQSIDHFANQLTSFDMVQFSLKDVSDLISEYFISDFCFSKFTLQMQRKEEYRGQYKRK